MTFYLKIAQTLLVLMSIITSFNTLAGPRKYCYPAESIKKIVFEADEQLPNPSAFDSPVSKGEIDQIFSKMNRPIKNGIFDVKLAEAAIDSKAYEPSLLKFSAVLNRFLPKEQKVISLKDYIVFDSTYLKEIKPNEPIHSKWYGEIAKAISNMADHVWIRKQMRIRGQWKVTDKLSPELVSKQAKILVVGDTTMLTASHSDSINNAPDLVSLLFEGRQKDRFLRLIRNGAREEGVQSANGRGVWGPELNEAFKEENIGAVVIDLSFIKDKINPITAEYLQVLRKRCTLEKIPLIVGGYDEFRRNAIFGYLGYTDFVPDFVLTGFSDALPKGIFKVPVQDKMPDFFASDFFLSSPQSGKIKKNPILLPTENDRKAEFFKFLAPLEKISEEKGIETSVEIAERLAQRMNDYETLFSRSLGVPELPHKAEGSLVRIKGRNPDFMPEKSGNFLAPDWTLKKAEIDQFFTTQIYAKLKDLAKGFLESGVPGYAQFPKKYISVRGIRGIDIHAVDRDLRILNSVLGQLSLKEEQRKQVELMKNYLLQLKIVEKSLQ